MHRVCTASRGCTAHCNCEVVYMYLPRLSERMSAALQFTHMHKHRVGCSRFVLGEMVAILLCAHVRGLLLLVISSGSFGSHLLF